MVKFRKRHLGISAIFILFLSVLSYAQQNKSLQFQLWNSILEGNDEVVDVGGWSLQTFIDNKGWQDWDEWEDTMNSNVVVDDTQNGYLQINLFYEQTTAGAYKDKSGNYTILKNKKYRHFNRSISSNRNLDDVLPKDFGIAYFISDTINVESLTYSSFYLEADIPRKGTDTQLNLKLIPLGLLKKGKILTYEIKEYNDEKNMFLYGFRDDLIKKLNDELTLSYLVEKKYKAISAEDKRVMDEFIAKDYQFENIEAISELLTQLNTIYKLNSAIKHKSIVLGWNRDKGRFFVRDQIKNDAEKVSFKEFLENSEIFMAVQ